MGLNVRAPPQSTGSEPGSKAHRDVREQMGTPRLGGAATWGLPSRISLLHSFRGCYLTENSVHGAPYHVEQHARTRHLQAFWLLKLGEQDKL